VPSGAARCPVCDAPQPGGGAPTPAPIPPLRRSPSPVPAARREEMEQRMSKLRQWALGARSLGVELPQVPAWAEEYIRSGEEFDGWADAVRGIERIAQQRVVQSIDAWQHQVQGRLRRLEAYSVDSRLEREEIEDALHAAKGGDVGRALSTYQRVDRVVALKEKHLDQAREELERLVALLQDMRALDIPVPDDPEELSDELEKELRRGKLAPFKQRLREMHTSALAELERSVPLLVGRLGDLLVKNRSDGLRIDPDAATLARGARAFAQGRAEEAVRTLRRVTVSATAGGVRPSAPADVGGTSAP
jgi:hypothetical protein